MMIGIDPSYRGTGLACVVNGKVISTKRFTALGNIYDISHDFFMIDNILNEVHSFISECVGKHPKEEINILVEYPALRTPSGAYLAILMGALGRFLKESFPLKSLYYVPPTACDSFTGNSEHNKSYLVNFVKRKRWVKGTVSHDEATAVIFCALLSKIIKGKYSHSYFKVV